MPNVSIYETLEPRVLYSGVPGPLPVDTDPASEVEICHLCDEVVIDHDHDEHELHITPVAQPGDLGGTGDVPVGVGGIAISPNHQGNTVIWEDINYTEAEVFSLHSNPNAGATVYLDFDGHTTSGTWWDNGSTFQTLAFSTDADRNSWSFNDLRAIHDIWMRVSEDFAPFNVNITTEDPGIEALRKTSATDTEFGVRVVVGPKTGMPAMFQSAGGIAYLYTFDNHLDLPAFSFNGDRSSNPGNVSAMTISHEVGHTLGLTHDGLNGSSYHPGTTVGGVEWGPLMGAPFGADITQWSQGGYAGADQFQDDLNIITTSNSFDYRVDDFGDSIGAATSLNNQFAGSFTETFGLIERNTDSDFFHFYAGAGSATIDISGLPVDSNLDILAEILDSSGTVIHTSDPDFNLNASFTVNLPARGEYYVRVTGTGQAGLYNDYGSLGSYRVSGTVQPFSNNQVPTALDINLSTNEETLITIPIAPYVSDFDGDAISLTSVFGASNGQISFNALTGVISYRPDLDFNGTDTFTYEVTDNKGLPVQAQVTILVNPVNDHPVAQPMTLSIKQGASAAISTVGLYSDVDSASVSVTAAGGANSGTVTLDPATGTISYVPDPTFSGTDVIIYEVTDTEGATTVSIITITVTPVVIPVDPTVVTVVIPKAGPIEITPTELNPETENVITTSLLDEDEAIAEDQTVSFSESGEIVISIASENPENPTQINSKSDTVRFTPNPEFEGLQLARHLTLKKSQPTGTDFQQAMAIPVSFAVPESRAIIVEMGGAISLEVWVDETHRPEIESTGNGKHGKVALVDGVMVYVPENGFTGKDSFGFTVKQPNGQTITESVEIEVVAPMPSLFPNVGSGVYPELPLGNLIVIAAAGRIAVPLRSKTKR